MIDRALFVDVTVQSEQSVDISVQTEQVVEISVSSNSGDRFPFYTGDYTVTPTKRQIVLPTKHKSMSDDVTVFQIPYAEVQNQGGGLTATIGLE